MEMNYFKKTGKMMVAACMLAGLPFIPGTVSASELQTQMMSVQMESTTLKELFDLIEEKFNYTFLIRNNDINLNERISIDMSNRSVEEILTTALKNQHADFVVNNNRIVVYKSSSNPNELRNTERMVAQQTITISGTIVDAVTGEPVIGANVLVKGTTNGTSTDFDGKFSLEAPAGATLVVSYIGYVNHEVKATSAPMTIRIKEDTQNLEEVVVVGYGVQKKESLTGAMQVVSNEKLLDATSPTVENLLSGKAPGVQVTSGGGQPGAAGKVVIRGKSTVNGSTDPLWIVDGVIVGTDAGSLNPADIESMSILKDAASTAIYGSQGANGVIVVTTKKGKIGKATINASVKMGVNQLHRGNMNMMNGEELYDYYKSFANQDALPSYFTEDLRNRNFDWWKEGTHLGFAQDYNVSVSGGSEKIKTYTSVGYYNEDGAVKGYDYKRYNLRFNVDYQATDWLTIKPKVWATRSDVMDQQQDLGAIMYVNFPWDSPYDENGDLIQQYRPTTWINSDATNYLYDLQWNYEKKTSYEFMGNFDFDIKFTDWLTFASVNNYKYNSILFKSYQDPRSKKGEADNGLLQDKTTASYRVYSNQLLRFNKVFDKHSINAILAYEWNTFTQEIKDQTAASFAPGFSVADVATTPKTIKGEQKEWAVQSYLFNANYAYDNRYLLSFSFRRDGASNFGTDAKYGNFFSVSGGWNIHQEEFFKAKDWVQQLKLRASYGSVGNRPTELYSQYTVYAMSTGYNGDPGAVIEQKENKNLTWEKTYTAGVGIDAILFDRLTINLDYYNKKTTDLLYKVPLPGVTGIVGIYRNVGAVKNNGFEVSMNVDILKGGDWSWSVAANLGLNRNKITELYGGKSEIITSNAGSSYAISMDKILTPGQDVDTWYGTEWAGVDPETGSPLWYTTNENGERVTTSNYSDASKHQTIIGKLSPDFYGGFSTDLSWRIIMKKIAIVALAAAATFITSCDIERLPYDKYTEDKIMEDKDAAVDVLLNGCYAKLKKASEHLHYCGEFPGDNVCKDKPTTNPFGTYFTYQHTVNNGGLTTVWNSAYNIISQTSSLMKMINEGESAELDQKLGEAYYMRGMMYFYLCRVFGRPYYQEPEKNLGLPIVNGMPEDMDNLDLPDRSSVKDTYDQALSDLKKAEELMTTFKSTAYASKYAAQALLAKVYMYMSGTFENPDKEYAQLSYDYANTVIESGQFSMLDRANFMRYNEFAPDAASQTETIFAVKFIASDWEDWGDPLGSMYAEIDGQGWGEVYASAKYMDLLHETGKGTDAREAFIHPQYKEDANGNQIPAFRFVANLYTDGKISGYVYRQGETKEVGGKLIATVDGEEYTLTPVDVDNKRYSISYKGETYEGDYDYFMLESQGNPKFYSYKCSKQDGYPHLYSPVISRLGELYLIRAEASAKLGNYTKALADLNTVRTRSLPNAGYKSLDATNAHELIMKERQLELAYEADRGFDVYRVGDTMKRHYPGFHDGVPEYPATSPLAIQYIPQSEINAYPGTLTQNP